MSNFIQTNNRQRAKYLITQTYETRIMEFESLPKIKDDEIYIAKCVETWSKYPHYQDGRLVRNKDCFGSFSSIRYKISPVLKR